MGVYCSEWLTIGGVSIRTVAGFPLFDPPDSPYVSFTQQPVGPDGQNPAIDVEVLLATCPPDDSPVLFESGAWTMQLQARGYRLSFRRGVSKSVHTVVCSDPDTTRVSVHMRQDTTPGSLTASALVNPVRHPVDQLLLMNHLAVRGGLIVHAAGAVIAGKALVLPGVSGAGKSTLCGLFLEAGLGGGLLSDDRMVLRTAAGRSPDCESPSHGGAEAWGTPWSSDAQVARNAGAPLGALLFLAKAEVTELVSLAEDVAMRRLMPVVSCPWYDAERLPLVLDSCARMVETIPCYELRFRPDSEVVELLTGRSWDATEPRGPREACR